MKPEFRPMFDYCVSARMSELLRSSRAQRRTWQFCCTRTAVDGCHIAIKFPAGGLLPCKEYHSHCLESK